MDTVFFDNIQRDRRVAIGSHWKVIQSNPMVDVIEGDK